MKPLMIFLSLALPTLSFAKGADFSGCKGTGIFKSSKGQSVDVSGELKASQSRVRKICENELPRRLEDAKNAVAQCVSGKPDAGRFAESLRADVSKFNYRIQSACQKMNEVFAVSEKYCNGRAATLASAQAKASQQVNAAPVGGQTGALRAQQGLLHGAAADTGALAQQAEAAAKKIYDLLPDRDAPSSLQQGKESAHTPDPQLDAIVANLKQNFTTLSQDNQKPQACGQVAKNGGKLDQISQILKQNLWPNGKRAARSLSALGANDRTKAAGYTGMKDEVTAQADKMEQGSDISGTEAKAAGKDLSAEKAQEAANLKRASASGDFQPEEVKSAERVNDKYFEGRAKGLSEDEAWQYATAAEGVKESESRPATAGGSSLHQGLSKKLAEEKAANAETLARGVKAGGYTATEAADYAAFNKKYYDARAMGYSEQMAAKYAEGAKRNPVQVALTEAAGGAKVTATPATTLSPITSTVVAPVKPTAVDPVKSPSAGTTDTPLTSYAPAAGDSAAVTPSYSTPKTDRLPAAASSNPLQPAFVPRYCQYGFLSLPGKTTEEGGCVLDWLW